MLNSFCWDVTNPLDSFKDIFGWDCEYRVIVFMDLRNVFIGLRKKCWKNIHNFKYERKQ